MGSILCQQLKESPATELLCLNWSRPPQNVLLVKKDSSEAATNALKEFAEHVKLTYSEVNLILEKSVAEELGDHYDFNVYSANTLQHGNSAYHDKVDLVVTFGGDGTILHASSLFAASERVPPVLSFSMGTLGFLGEWKFSEYKRAFRETYMSGSETSRRSSLQDADTTPQGSKGDQTGWSSTAIG
ncbi:NADH kinase pos5 [Elasticomyces elasticus]|nr:NADH kinase pos5 [Elasticomyces elasticus]